MIASAGTSADHAFGGERGGHQRRRRAALQERGEAEAGGEGGEAVAERMREDAPQVRAERAQDAAVDHVQAPQQQRDAAHQIEKNDRAHSSPVCQNRADSARSAAMTANRTLCRSKARRATGRIAERLGDRRRGFGIRHRLPAAAQLGLRLFLGGGGIVRRAGHVERRRRRRDTASDRDAPPSPRRSSAPAAPARAYRAAVGDGGTDHPGADEHADRDRGERGHHRLGSERRCFQQMARKTHAVSSSNSRVKSNASAARCSLSRKILRGNAPRLASRVFVKAPLRGGGVKSARRPARGRSRARACGLRSSGRRAAASAAASPPRSASALRGC